VFHQRDAPVGHGRRRLHLLGTAAVASRQVAAQFSNPPPPRIHPVLPAQRLLWARLACACCAGLRLGGRDVTSFVLTRLLAPSVFALPFWAGNNANATSVSTSLGEGRRAADWPGGLLLAAGARRAGSSGQQHTTAQCIWRSMARCPGALHPCSVNCLAAHRHAGTPAGGLLVPAVAEADAFAATSREFVGRANATAVAIAEGDLVPFVVASSNAFSSSLNLFGQSFATAKSNASADVAAFVVADSTAFAENSGGG